MKFMQCTTSNYKRNLYGGDFTNAGGDGGADYLAKWNGSAGKLLLLECMEYFCI